jgi:hypothetical protein
MLALCQNKKSYAFRSVDGCRDFLPYPPGLESHAIISLCELESNKVSCDALSRSKNRHGIDCFFEFAFSAKHSLLRRSAKHSLYLDAKRDMLWRNI